MKPVLTLKAGHIHFGKAQKHRKALSAVSLNNRLATMKVFWASSKRLFGSIQNYCHIRVKWDVYAGDLRVRRTYVAVV